MYKKPPGDIILLHMCTINEDPMMYGSHVFRNFDHFQKLCEKFQKKFSPLTPLTTWKFKILIKWKKYMEILLFQSCVSQMTIS